MNTDGKLTILLLRVDQKIKRKTTLHSLTL